MQTLNRKNLFFLCSLIISLLLSTTTVAKTNETLSPAEKPPIKIGTSTSLTGGASLSGKNVTLGINIYFDKVNAAGGIEGQKLKLIVLDDGYEPLRAASNMHQLIDQDNVLAIIGNNGTPAAVVAVPIVNKNKILLLAARTGSNLLRKIPPDRYVINMRASYNDEVNALIKGLDKTGIKPENIAFFTQNDAFGDSIYQAGVKTFKDMGYTDPIPQGRYNRNSLDVASAFSHIIEHTKHPLKAFILGGVYGPNAQFIKLAKSEYPDALYLTISGLINPSDLHTNVSGQVISSQVVPDINSDLPAAIEFRKDMKKYGGGALPSSNTFEGYLAAKLFVMGLQKAIKENKLTREGIIDAIESMHDIDLGIGIKINYTKKDHHGLDTVWMTVFKDGKFVSTDWPNSNKDLKK